MVVLDTIQEWQHQSSLLLQARPTTARITTKYNIPNLESPRYQKQKKRKRDAETEEKDAASAPRVPKAVLTLKTYDPESGVCLKFKTDRAADVGRLINGLSRLGRHMAALPPKSEDTVMDDVPAIGDSGAQAQDPASNAPAGDRKEQQPSGGPAGKKKKKGKK